MWIRTQSDDAFLKLWILDAPYVAHIQSKVYQSPKVLYLRVMVVEAGSSNHVSSLLNHFQEILEHDRKSSLKIAYSLFQIDPITLLTANANNISYPDVEHHILPRSSSSKSPSPALASTTFANSSLLTTRPAPPTPSFIADVAYAGLVSSNQLREANSIFDPSVLDVGQNLVIPLPCTCFNSSDNSLPAIYLSYVVRLVDTLVAIAARYFTMNVNAMGSTAINDEDILTVQIPDCIWGTLKDIRKHAIVNCELSFPLQYLQRRECGTTPERVPQMQLAAPPFSLLLILSRQQQWQHTLTPLP
ncbi:LysM domain-containing GPI-anchored protein 1 [Glycine soja]|uniref:LysM domain-containing GPI-anchored protein 1 n=1 Tax=Glycine soja TaxID=3848 RepID=A0A445HNR7_GLYSO|nr:LysM domain-containing GPI-anchored protein 1 [Glycine soja]